MLRTTCHCLFWRLSLALLSLPGEADAHPTPQGRADEDRCSGFTRSVDAGTLVSTLTIAPGAPDIQAELWDRKRQVYQMPSH